MRVAIYQLGKFHTEIFGFLLDALGCAGHDLVIYNDPDDDLCSFLRYYDKLFERRLVVRPCGTLLAEHAGYDKILMTTVDDFIWSELSRGESSDRIIAIEHERGWWRPELACHVGLSPFVSSPHLFPVYAKPRAAVHRSVTHTPSRSHRLHLAIVGDVTPAKHIEEITAFLDHSAHTRVTFFARKASFLVHQLRTHAGTERVVLRDNVASEELVEALESDAIDAIWTPIRHGFCHSTFKLSGALPLAFNLQKLLIVPDMIAEAYDLDGVVVYRNGVDGLCEMLRGWDDKSEDHWTDLSQRAALFVQRTVAENRLLLDRMIETGVGASRARDLA